MFTSNASSKDVSISITCKESMSRSPANELSLVTSLVSIDIVSATIPRTVVTSSSSVLSASPLAIEGLQIVVNPCFSCCAKLMISWTVSISWTIWSCSSVSMFTSNASSKDVSISITCKESMSRSPANELSLVTSLVSIDIVSATMPITVETRKSVASVSSSLVLVLVIVVVKELRIKLSWFRCWSWMMIESSWLAASSNAEILFSSSDETIG